MPFRGSQPRTTLWSTPSSAKLSNKARTARPRRRHPFTSAWRSYRQPKFNEAEVLALLKRCTGDFKDVKIEQEGEPDTTVAELAEPVVFEIEHLTVGKAAADISGTDLDGKAFKLSDYRGKVVVWTSSPIGARTACGCIPKSARW